MRSSTRMCLGIIVVLAIAGLAHAEQVDKTDHVTVTYAGIDQVYAKAIARVLESARKSAVDEFAFDMPDMINVTVDCKAGNPVRLFNDGQDHISLSIRTPADLKAPTRSGIFNLYGMCHELGHLAMYRPIRKHDFLTGDAKESWAHFIGSRLVDSVWAAEGEKLWPDAYDYRADGMTRLNAQLNNTAMGRLPPTVVAAGLWKELAGIIGDKKLGELMKAWGTAQVDAADPAPAMKEALLAVSNDAKVTAWWQRAEGVLVFKRPRSDMAATTIALRDLSGQATEVAKDDGKSAGKSSIAGSGHAVILETPGEGFYLTGVRIFGSRYGRQQPPQENFQVWLCDAEGKVIREFAFPYKSFAWGQANWVKLTVEPTEVPRKFMICVGFNPTATKGVYMSYDAQADGEPKVGLPGGGMGPFAKGDWLIRAIVDQPKGADALRN